MNLADSRGQRWVAPAALSAIMMVLAGCGGAGEQASKMTSFSTTENPKSKAELFSLPADQMSHIQVVTVEQGPLPRTLRMTGAVEYNDFKTTPVITQVGGPVSRVAVVQGEHVRAGQALLYIASPDYSLLRAAYIKARDAFQLADKFYLRAQDLYAHRAIAQADLEQAQSNRTQAQADFESSADAIRVLGIADPETIVTKPPSPEIPLYSPVAGEVVDRQCSAGQLLAAGATQCFTLSDMSSVWILINIYQNDVAYVHVGDPVTIDNESYPEVVHGKIEYISPALDPNTRTLQARIEAPNPGERLKKEMYVTAEVQAGVIPRALFVPHSAVLRDEQNMPYVYLQTGQRQFAKRDVTLGESQAGKTQILTGLQVNDRVVGDGSLFLQFQNSLQH
ncbi:Secretion protein HlyD [Candidatus Sulfotelmatobacter kueseliae]|uniref:Secretion protein HlyD n=1 Tax=Candidatus Sulfotelmatobacter kueseliae TaxID=2042962 RepID=A0A2U3JY16_9BACT|nr:Secretion protein HlyD [Candidatus Sulfotelmatobacter kueseliae]